MNISLVDIAALVVMLAPLLVALFKYVNAVARGVDLTEDTKRQDDLKNAIWSAVRSVVAAKEMSQQAKVQLIMEYVNKSVPEALNYHIKNLAKVENMDISHARDRVEQVVQKQAEGILNDVLNAEMLNTFHVNRS